MSELLLQMREGKALQPVERAKWKGPMPHTALWLKRPKKNEKEPGWYHTTRSLLMCKGNTWAITDAPKRRFLGEEVPTFGKALNTQMQQIIEETIFQTVQKKNMRRFRVQAPDRRLCDGQNISGDLGAR